MDFLGFWGAAAWFNRAFLVASFELGCESGIIGGVLEPCVFLGELGDTLSFEDHGFSAVYDNRCFDYGVYYGGDRREEKDTGGASGNGLGRSSESSLKLLSEKAFERGAAEYDMTFGSVCESVSGAGFEKSYETFLSKGSEVSRETEPLVHFETGLEGGFLREYLGGAAAETLGNRVTEPLVNFGAGYLGNFGTGTEGGSAKVFGNSFSAGSAGDCETAFGGDFGTGIKNASPEGFWGNFGASAESGLSKGFLGDFEAGLEVGILKADLSRAADLEGVCGAVNSDNCESGSERLFSESCLGRFSADIGGNFGEAALSDFETVLADDLLTGFDGGFETGALNFSDLGLKGRFSRGFPNGLLGKLSVGIKGSLGKAALNDVGVSFGGGFNLGFGGGFETGGLADSGAVIDGSSGAFEMAAFDDVAVRSVYRGGNLNLLGADCGFGGDVVGICADGSGCFADGFSGGFGKICYSGRLGRFDIGRRIDTVGNASSLGELAGFAESCIAAGKEFSAAYVNGYEHLAEEAVSAAPKMRNTEGDTNGVLAAPVSGALFGAKELWAAAGKEAFSAYVKGYEHLAGEAVLAAPKICKAEGEAGGIFAMPVSGALVCDKELRELRGTVGRENVSYFTSAEIKIDVSGGGALGKELDMDELTRRLSEAIGEAMVNISEGVHNI